MSEPDEVICPEHGPMCSGAGCCCADLHVSPVSEPDETMVEAVARAINAADNEWADAPRTMSHEVWPTHVARAALSVPMVRDALARDAKVREIVAATAAEVRNPQPGSPPGAYIFAEGMDDVFNLYPSPGVRVDSEEQK